MLAVGRFFAFFWTTFSVPFLNRVQAEEKAQI